MTTFQALFGIKESEVKNTCVLMPILRKDLLSEIGVRWLSKGRLYGSGNSNIFTLIHTGIGSALLGDAVLHLEKTACQNIILFGSCGLVKQKGDLRIGGLVTPSGSYSLEGFTEMLLKNKKKWPFFSGDKTLLEKFLKMDKVNRTVKKVICASIGSLKLEEDYVALFKKKGIGIVDMECSALFSASEYIHRQAMALFYITDIVNKKPFYRDLRPEERSVLSSSIKSGAHILCEFIKKNLNF